MIVETETGRLVARCEACRLASPQMLVPERTVAGEMLRAAGWSIDGHATYCPPCSGLRHAGALLARRARRSARSPEPGP